MPRKEAWRADIITAGGSYLPSPSFVIRAALHRDKERVIRIELTDRQKLTELRAALTAYLAKTK